MHMLARVLVGATALVVLTSCDASGAHQAATGGPTPRPTFTSAGGPMPTEVPGATGPVRSQGLVTIADNGAGPALCLAGAESFRGPPRCSSPKVRGWDWDHWRGQFEEHAGVRWGRFVVTGAFDGRVLTITGAVPEALYDAPVKDEENRLDQYATRCPEPPGGWRVLDAQKTTQETADAVFNAAERLPGYVTSWQDGSRIPPTDGDQNDPRLITVNVQVTGDPSAADAALRKVWGGALCVTRNAAPTFKERSRAMKQLVKLPGALSVGVGSTTVEVEVVHDDGSLQAWADATYGRGVVTISSALAPASG